MVVEKVIQAPYVPGAYEFISDHHRDYRMYISTGTPKEEMEEILIKRGLRKFFEGVYGSPEGKDEHIRKIIDKYKYNPKEIIFIGDSYSDLDASKQNKIHFLLRIHDYNNKQFADYHGDYVNDLVHYDAS